MRLRLQDIIPHDVARDAARDHLDRLAVYAEGLASVRGGALPAIATPPEETRLYATLWPVARFAVTGEPLLTTPAYEASVSLLVRWLGESAVIQAVPATPLAMVVAGAEARLELAQGAPLTSMQIALLSGLDRDHINGFAIAGRIPSAYRSTENRHKPWRFRPTQKLRGWLGQYGLVEATS